MALNLKAYTIVLAVIATSALILALVLKYAVNWGSTDSLMEDDQSDKEQDSHNQRIDHVTTNQSTSNNISQSHVYVGGSFILAIVLLISTAFFRCMIMQEKSRREKTNNILKLKHKTNKMLLPDEAQAPAPAPAHSNSHINHPNGDNISQDPAL